MLHRLAALCLCLLPSLCLAQGSKILLQDDLLHKGAYYDIDTQTVLSREQVGALQAEFVWQANGLEAVGEARFEWITASRFLVRGASGATARIDLKNATAKLSGASMVMAAQASTYNRGMHEHQAIRIALQLDGSDVFPESLENLRVAQHAGNFQISWSQDVEALITDAVSGKELARGLSPLAFPADSELQLRIVRLLPDGGESMPLRRHLFPGDQLVSELVEKDRRNLFPLKFRGGPPLDFRNASPGFEACLLPGGLKAFVEASDFRDIEWSTPRGYVGGETYLMRFEDERLAIMYCDPRTRVGYSRGTTSSRGQTLSMLTESTEHRPPERQRWLFLADGAWSLPEGPGHVLLDDTRLSWDAVEGAQSYAVSIWDPEALDFSQLGTTEETSYELGALPDNASWAVHAQLADGRRSAGGFAQYFALPAGWQHGSFTLNVGDGFLFDDGSVVENARTVEFQAGAFDVLMQQSAPLRIECPRAFFPSQTEFGTFPPLFELRTQFMGGRRAYEGMPSCFWLQTAGGTFVQFAAIERGDSVRFEFFAALPDREAKIDALMQEFPHPSEADLAQVDTILEELEAIDPETREAAEEKLRALKTATIHRLRQVLADDSWSPEVTMRMESLLEEFWAPQPTEDPNRKR